MAHCRAKKPRRFCGQLLLGVPQTLYCTLIISGQGPAADIGAEGPVWSGAAGEAPPGGGVEERHRGEGAHHRGAQDQGHPAQGQFHYSSTLCAKIWQLMSFLYIQILITG